MASDGDPRVLLALNLLLSTTFAYLVLWGLDFIGAVTFSIPRLAGVALVLVVLTHLVIM